MALWRKPVPSSSPLCLCISASRLRSFGIVLLFYHWLRRSSLQTRCDEILLVLPVSSKPIPPSSPLCPSQAVFRNWVLLFHQWLRRSSLQTRCDELLLVLPVSSKPIPTQFTIVPFASRLSELGSSFSPLIETFISSDEMRRVTVSTSGFEQTDSSQFTIVPFASRLSELGSSFSPMIETFISSDEMRRVTVSTSGFEQTDSYPVHDCALRKPSFGIGFFFFTIDWDVHLFRRDATRYCTSGWHLERRPCQDKKLASAWIHFEENMFGGSVLPEEGFAETRLTRRQSFPAQTWKLGDKSQEEKAATTKKRLRKVRRLQKQRNRKMKEQECCPSIMGICRWLLDSHFIARPSWSLWKYG